MTHIAHTTHTQTDSPAKFENVSANMNIKSAQNGPSRLLPPPRQTQALHTYETWTYRRAHNSRSAQICLDRYQQAFALSLHLHGGTWKQTHIEGSLGNRKRIDQKGRPSPPCLFRDMYYVTSIATKRL